MAADPHLGVRPVGLRVCGEEVDVVDGVGAHAKDIAEGAGRGRRGHRVSSIGKERERKKAEGTRKLWSVRREWMRLNCSRVYMLASDHRWQWEEWCDTTQVPRGRIPEIKSLVVDAFLRARDRSDDVRRYGSVLLDNKYGAEAVARAQAAHVPVGTPVEKAGMFPLEWEREPFHAGSPGNSFSKVLIRYRPEWPEADRQRQTERLLELQRWCRAEAIPLLVEIIVMRQGEDERDVRGTGTAGDPVRR